MEGAGIGRRRDEFYWPRPPWVAHIDDSDPITEHVADKGVALMHHDLDAVATAVEVVAGNEIDVARGFGRHLLLPRLVCLAALAKHAGTQPSTRWTPPPDATLIRAKSPGGGRNRNAETAVSG